MIKVLKHSGREGLVEVLMAPLKNILKSIKAETTAGTNGTFINNNSTIQFKHDLLLLYCTTSKYIYACTVDKSYTGLPNILVYMSAQLSGLWKSLWIFVCL